jgi:hypothetical protein
MSDLPDAIERLVKRVEALERRVEALEPRVGTLEHPLAARWPHPTSEPKPESTAPTPAAAPQARPASPFPVLGKAMLGIAGAYVLRAVEDSSTVPKLAVALAGLAYAFLWLAGAARTRGGPRFADAIYACTSALILAPMLWELTLRFKVLTPAVAAGVLCAFALAAVGLAWKREQAPLLRVAWIAAAALALSLAVASHVMMPFVTVLLILTAACELTPAFVSVPDIRALMALVADAAIWTLIFVYFNPQNAREDYPPLGKAALLAPGFVVFLLFAAVVIFKTVFRAKRITAFETIQTTIAFLLAAVSLADFGPSHGPALLGAACLLLSGAGYAAFFTVLERAQQRRNAGVFAAWSAALLLAGSLLCLPPLPLVLLLGAGAFAALIAARWKGRPSLELTGMVFLAAAAAASGLPSFVAAVWTGTPPGAPSAGAWITAVCAVLSYAAVMSKAGETWLAQAFHLVLAALASAAVIALLAQGMYSLVAIKAIPGAHHLAFIRTFTLCGAALALVYGGTRWRRPELTRLGYASMGLVAVKLLFEDLRHGHLGYIAASIFLVALTLIAAPRVARARQKA